MSDPTEPTLEERIKSAATPDVRGALGEREAIAVWLERETHIDRMGSRHPYVAETLRWAAREIREGAHHREG